MVKIRATRHWTDWVGVLVFTAIGVNLWRQSPEFGLLILPALIQELIVAVSFLLRARATRAARGWLPRVIAYAHTFALMVFLWYAAARHPEWIRATPQLGVRQAGTMLWLIGAVASFWPLWCLRQSFSIEPEARTLVTSGPYRLARHPIYAVYALINAGMLLGHLTVPFASAVVLWFALLLIRVRNEEAVLTAAFPNYEAYRRRVGAFGPRLGLSKLVGRVHGERAG